MHATEANILLYLENKLSPGNTEEMKEHFSQCHQCREQLVAILRLPSVIGSPDVHRIDGSVLARAQQLGAPRRSTPFRFSLSPFGKLALATLVFVSAGIAYFFLEEPPTPSRFRDRAPAPLAFSMLPSEGAMVTQRSETFRWSAMKNALGYQVALYRENGTPLWQGTSKDTLLVLPEEVVLQPGKIYLWRVETFFPDQSNYVSKLNTFVYSP
jgi:hypothetical protein